MISIKRRIIKIFIIASLIITSCFFTYQELAFIRSHNIEAIMKLLKSELKDYNVEIEDVLINTNTLYKEHDKAYNELTKLLKVEKIEESLIENKLSELTTENDNNKRTVATLTTTYNETETKEKNAYQSLVAAKSAYEKRISSHFISNVPTYNQYPSYPNGCEGIALYLLLSYHKVSLTPADLFAAMPKQSALYWDNGILYGGNPFIGYIGNPEDSTGYGVYERPLITTANNFKSGIINATGTPLNDLLKIIRQDRPILVWATINMNDTFPLQSWIYPLTGETMTWYANEHAMVIIGYDATQIIVSDPINGQIRYFNRTTFESRYNFFGRRALYY